MEQVQRVTAHVAAAKLGDARVLFDDLEAHRRELRGLRGSLGMTITRSIEPGGDTLVSVETRWKDPAVLDEYVASPRNAEGTIRDHADILVPDTLNAQVFEALDTAGPPKSTVVYNRFVAALMVPMVIFGVGFAIIYSLSRIYLQLETKATPVAIIISLGILLVAWYFAENRSAPVWQLGAIGAAAAAVLVGGTIYAQVNGLPHAESLVEASPTSGPQGTVVPGAPPEIHLNDNFFSLAGSSDKNPTITVKQGDKVSIKNAGSALHNMHVSPFEKAICNPADPSPCSEPPRINGGASGSITFDVAPGTYDYRCDFHTSEMHGTLVVQ